MRQLINAHDDDGTAHPSKRRFGIGLLVGLSFLAGMAFAPAFADAKDKLQEVLIANDATNPVPISGAVSVSEPVEVFMASPDLAEPYACELEKKVPLNSDFVNLGACPAPPAGTRLHITDVGAYSYFVQGQPPQGIDAAITPRIFAGDATVFLPAGEFFGQQAITGRQASVILDEGESISAEVGVNWRPSDFTSQPQIQIRIAGYLEPVN